MGKRSFIIKRIIHMGITLFLLITIVFLMFRLLPGDPLAMYVNTDMPSKSRRPC